MEIKVTDELKVYYQMDLAELFRDKLKIEIIGGAVEFQINSALDSMSSGNFEASIDLCKIVIDYVWEQLNKGHWKDVAISWRYTYSLISMMKVLSEYAISIEDDSKVTFDQVMKSCDMGLLMGAPVGDNILARLCTTLRVDYENRTLIPKTLECSPVEHRDEPIETCLDEGSASDKGLEVVSEKLIELMQSEYLMKKVACPTIETFRRDYFATQTPVVITNAMDGWPALGCRKWTLDYIKRIAGYRTVPIELGSKYTDEAWSQKLMTVQEFITKYIERRSNETDVGYLAQHQLFNQIPELQNDLVIPDYCYLGDSDDVDINAWFGPKGTVSPLHYDPKHNFLAQVLGEKYIRIYPYSESDKMYPHQTTVLKNTSRVDLENPQVAQFPQFVDAGYVECVLRSGEMLYMPPMFWHFVKSISVSFSVSFWWE